MIVDSTFDLMAQHAFLAGLTRRQLERLSYWGHSALLHNGSTIFEEGTRADRFYLIVEGSVRLTTHLPGRPEVLVETLGPGSVLGWSWLFPPYRWNFTATAAELTHVVSLDGPGIREVCDQDPVLGNELYGRFMRVLVDRLQHTRQRLLEAYAEQG